MEQYRVVTFGGDCLGNITGYRVVRGMVTAGQFVGDIYEPGSFARAAGAANDLCSRLNSETFAEPERLMTTGEDNVGVGGRT